MPKMSYYFNNMNALHISYAVGNGGYVRTRRYPKIPGVIEWNETIAPPLYSGVGLFSTGVKYHLTIIKRDQKMFFEVENTETGERKVFVWSVEQFDPITEGRIGLRQMFQRISLYDNFKVYGLR